MTDLYKHLETTSVSKEIFSIPQKLKLTCITFTILLVTVYTTFFLLIFCSTNIILSPINDLIPENTIPSQFFHSPRIYPTQCDEETCPIISLLTHNMCPTNYIFKDNFQQTLNDYLNRTINQAEPPLFDGLYTLVLSEYDQEHFHIRIKSLKSVYSVAEAKVLLLKSPVLLTLTNGTNDKTLNNVSLEIPVETGRTFHVTTSVVNVGVKTHCIVGWDDTYSGGGFIVHNGIHSIGYYTGNVSQEAENVGCKHSRGYVDIVKDPNEYQSNELFHGNATKLRCVNENICNLNGFYTLHLTNPLGWRVFTAKMHRFSDDQHFIETILFDSIGQYEFEYLFVSLEEIVRNEYCAYSFLSYDSLQQLSEIFVLQQDLDHLQLSIAFTSFDVSLYDGRKEVDLSKYIEEHPNAFDSNSIFFSENES
ncbi:Peptidase A1 domain-containing protein [Entamoeba marina]